MPHTTLVSPTDVRPRLQAPGWVFVDCRFSLADPERGRRAYREAHLPGAVYAHLDDDLSGPARPGQTGRHPLPDPEPFAATLSGWGVTPNAQVVVYDDAGGAIAARLWWMLRWLGHDAVAVLDGGWPRWLREGGPVESGDPPPAHAGPAFVPRVRPERVAGTEAVQARLHDPATRLIDARARARYLGLEEPIDPVAGHIPGAASAPFGENLDEAGCFLPRAALRARFEDVLGGVPPERAVCYCGSGVTAAHDLLAMAHAGLPGSRLYPGSWSAWITDPERPVETAE